MLKLWILLTLILSLETAVAAAQNCRLAVNGQGLSSADVKQLQTKNFDLVKIADLDFNSYRISRYLPTVVPYGLEKREASFRLSFPYRGEQVERMISLEVAGLEILKNCEQLRTLVKQYAEARNFVDEGLRYFGSPLGRGQTLLGETQLRAEGTYDILRGQKPRTELALKKYRALIDSIRKTVAPALFSNPESFFTLHDKIRGLLFDYGLSTYCRDQVSLTDFLINRCANCSAQSKLFSALYRDLGVQMPSGWQMGSEVFADHVRPVLVNFESEMILDLMYNQKTAGLPNPIMTQDGIIRKTFAKIKELRPGLFFETDQGDLSNTAAYLYRPDDTLKSRVRSFLGLKEEGTRPAMDKVTQQAGLSADATLFDVDSKNNFSEGAVPLRADLSGWSNSSSADAVAAAPSPTNRAAPTGGSGSNLGQQQALSFFKGLGPYKYLNSASIFALNSADRANFQAILYSGSLSEKDFMTYSFKRVRDYRICGMGDGMIMQPLRIKYEVPSGPEFRQARMSLELLPTGQQQVLTMNVFDQAVATQLESASLVERYNYLYAALESEARQIARTHRQTLVDFMADGDVVRHWNENENDIKQAVFAHNRLEQGVKLFGDGCTTATFMRMLIPGSEQAVVEMSHALRKNLETFSTRHREALKGLNELSEDSTSAFLAFYGWIASQNSMRSVSENGEKDLFDLEAWKFPLSVLLEKMLYDPDYLYTTALSERERQLYGKYFENLGVAVEPPKTEIQVPQANWKFKCPPEGGVFQSGSFVMECKPEKNKRQLKVRAPVLLQPQILPKLVLNAGLTVFRPTWAVLINHSWRDANSTVWTATAFKEQLDVTYEAERNRQLEGTLNSMSSAPLEGTDKALIAFQFHDYLDLLLAPNLPTFKLADLDPELLTGDRLGLEKFPEFMKGFRLQPEWIQSQQIYRAAYEFYQQFREAGSKERLKLMKMEEGTEFVIMAVPVEKKTFGMPSPTPAAPGPSTLSKMGKKSLIDLSLTAEKNKATELGWSLGIMSRLHNADQPQTTVGFNATKLGGNFGLTIDFVQDGRLFSFGLLNAPSGAYVAPLFYMH